MGAPGPTPRGDLAQPGHSATRGHISDVTDGKVLCEASEEAREAVSTLPGTGRTHGQEWLGSTGP